MLCVQGRAYRTRVSYTRKSISLLDADNYELMLMTFSNQMATDALGRQPKRMALGVMANIRYGARRNFHVLGAVCILALLGAGMEVDAFAKTITLEELGVLQLVAHDLFDVRRGDNITPESAVDFENGRLDLSTLLINTTSGNYFDDETIGMGGEVRNRENVILFTISAEFGAQYLAYKNDDGYSQEVAREKTIKDYHEKFATVYESTFGEPIPPKSKGQATPDGNIALRTIHDFLPGNITFNGVDTALLGIPPNVKLSVAELAQVSSLLDGMLDDEFLEIDISFPGGPMITVNLLEADQTFGDQFNTRNSFDDLLLELGDGNYNATDKAMVEIRNLISTAYPEEYQDEPTSLISVSSTNANGQYAAGDTIRINATLPEVIDVGEYKIVDEEGEFDTLGGARSVTTVTVDSSIYALVASSDDDGVQIIDITNPASPMSTAKITDNTIDNPSRFDELDGARSVTTTQIQGKHYALVAAYDEGGIQIIDITNPASPMSTANITDDSDGFGELNGVSSVTTTQIKGNHYALVTAEHYNGVQIIDITEPASPTTIANITDDSDGFGVLSGASSVTTTQIKGNHYALVASSDDDGVQIIDITEPASPMAIANITDNTIDNPSKFDELNGARSVTTTQIKGNHYALVASYDDDGVQIIDITDPARPMSTANITDGSDGFGVLSSASSVTTTQIGGTHYALVAADFGNGVQIIDITDPARPMSTANITDGSDGFGVLSGAYSVTTTQIQGTHYAIVASYYENSVQIIDITNPARPINPLLPFITLDTTPPARAAYKEQVGQTLFFEYDVRDGDYSPDLGYVGTDAFHLNSNTLQYFNGTSFPTSLPQPGCIGSLSYNRDISIGSLPIGVNPAKSDTAPYVVSVETGELDTIIVTMSEDVRNNCISDGFTISGVAPGTSINGIALSGSTITLSLSEEMADSDSPVLAYDSNTGSVTDLNGRPLASFDKAVKNTLDTTAPTVRSVTIDNSGTVYVRLSESVQGSADPGDFTTSNSSITVSTVDVRGSTITLELLGQIPDDEILTLTYTEGTEKIKDGNGNILASFDEQINKQSRKRSTSTSTPAVDLASLQSLGYVDSNNTAIPHDPFAPITPMNAGDQFNFAVAINDMHYMLGGSLNTLEPQTLLTGVPNTISFAVHDHADITHFTLYMNLHGQNTDYQDSDTYITYDMGSIRIVDPHDLISNATVSIKTNEADLLRHIVVFVITFENEMEQTNLVARTWNADSSMTMVRILNAFAVSAAQPDPQPTLSEDPMPDVMVEPEDSEPDGTTLDQDAIRMIIRTWSGFESGSVTDAQLLDALGLGHDGDMPIWTMTKLGVMCSQEHITLEEFTTAISYVVANI